MKRIDLKRFSLTACAALLLVVFFLSGCETARKKEIQKQIVPAEQEKPLSEQLTRNLTKAHGVWSESGVDRFLNDVTRSLVAADPALAAQLTRVQVKVLATGGVYVAPGFNQTIYISRGMLSVLNFENELAFVLASQLVLLSEDATTKSLANLQGQEVGESLINLPTQPASVHKNPLEKDWFEPGGLFDFGNDAYLRAQERGTRLTHAAKYDPRGAVTLLQSWSSDPQTAALKQMGKIWPDLEESLRLARDEVAKLSPLRDPIVRTAAFDQFQGKLRVKKAKQKKKN